MTLDDYIARIEIVGPLWCWKLPNKPDSGTNAQYVRIWINGVRKMAHRAIYEFLIKRIPRALTLDHAACQNEWCCNPNHVEPVTRGENTMRGSGPPALNALKTTCSHGHQYTEENTLRVEANGRQCRACNRTRARLHQRKLHGWSARPAGVR